MAKETSRDTIERIEQIVIDFGDICRFCLTETNNNISIHDKCFSDGAKEKDEATIFDFVTKITSIRMDNLDGFPSLVCENCFNVIKMCFEFRQSCRQSDYSLRDCYEKTLQEAKAKFSLEEIKVEDNQSVEDILNLTLKQETDTDVKTENCVDGYDDKLVPKSEEESCAGRENVNLRLKFKNKQIANVKESVSILKAGNIKQKYQRISSLSERLKEAQTKLIEDILRTKDIIPTVGDGENVNVKGEKIKYSCPQCNVSFLSPEMLTYHFITSHIGEKKAQKGMNLFQCRMCKREFGYMYQLMKHYKNMHKIPMSKMSLEQLSPKNKKTANDNGKSYECLDCKPPKVFSKRNNFLRHLTQHSAVENRLKHSLPKEGSTGKFYTCTRCNFDQTFTTKFSLNRHLMNIHKLDRSEIILENGSEVPNSNGQPPEGDLGGVDAETCNTAGLNLMKMYICLDCTPLASFSDISLFIEHKAEAHDKKIEEMSLKDLTPVYVESVNVFQQNSEGNSQTFKVICKICDSPTEFYSASDFVQHMKSHHDDVPKEKWDLETKFLLDSLSGPKRRDRMWKCTECPASYSRKNSLHYHLKEKHKKVLRVGGVKCPEPDCDASFLSNRQVIQHGITVHGKYFASLHKVFKEKILHAPGETDKRVRNFECDICQKKYLGKTSLKRHIFRSHLGMSEVENAICPYCGKTFTKSLNLKSHIEFVHEALFVSCPVCKKNINFKTIGKHYKTHQASTDYELGSKNRFLCNQCGRVLKSKSGFEDHQKLHLNVRDHICDVCGSGFTTKKNLYIHKKAHDMTQKKVFECDQCDKVFTGKHTLNRHLLTHSGEKNFICEICSKCFYTLQELNRHVRYHKKEYRFDCQLCDMRFLDRSRFRHHMMRHRNIRPHKCHFCDKVFIVRRKMNLHMAARHNVEVQSTKAVWKDPKTYIPLDDLL
ncbi:UNVERIFIED_CONTAM: hypothetical protein PYX00_003691 [Menopon gallinae]|uniref:Uncharacterized protein n=1 Tax=Menopon gallinae TaxID=328185 RepID=A0AAW2I2P1_9NEOP